MSDETLTREPKNPKEMRVWFEDFLFDTAKKMSRQPSVSRVNSVSAGVKSWTALYKLEKETASLEELEQAVRDLQQRLKTGPEGIVNESKG